MELEYAARKKKAKRFYAKVSAYREGMLGIYERPQHKGLGENGWNSREESQVWTFRDLLIAVLFWLNGTVADAKALWRSAETYGMVYANRPLLGGTNELLDEWKARKLDEQSEAFSRDVIVDEWGQKVKEGKAIVLIGTNRDADMITESNFDTAVKWFEGLGESARGVQWDTARYGHWAVGHVNYLFVMLANSDALRLAQYVSDKLEDYPMLNEDDVSRRESEEAWRWALLDASALAQYGDRDGLQDEIANLLLDGAEYDIMGGGNDTMQYRISVHEVAERFNLVMDEEDRTNAWSRSYGKYAKEPVPLNEWHIAEYSSFESMVRRDRRIARNHRWEKDWIKSQTKKGVRLVLTGNRGYIVRNGLVYEVQGRYAAQDVWERLIALDAENRSVPVNGFDNIGTWRIWFVIWNDSDARSFVLLRIFQLANLGNSDAQIAKLLADELRYRARRDTIPFDKEDGQLSRNEVRKALREGGINWQQVADWMLAYDMEN